MLQDFKFHIEDDFPFLKETPFLIAVSGGIDSVVLCHLFHDLKYNFAIAHCNFKLRGEASDADEDFVKNLGKKLKVEVLIASFETEKYVTKEKLSIQIAARELRYNWFEKLIKERGFSHVLTAHHADDNLETFFINLTRGSGLDGLIGIPKVNKNIARPLLKFSREAIEKYALSNKIEWREDASNAEQKYLRNKIRHRLIPILKEINPNILNSFERVSQNLSESKKIVDDKVSEISEKILEIDGDLIKISVSEVLKLSNPKVYLYQLLKEYNFTEWNNVKDLLKSQTGKVVTSKTHELLRDRDFLLLNKRNLNESLKTQQEIGIGTFKIDDKTTIIIEKSLKNEATGKNSILVNKNLVTFPMIIKKWEVGDFFYPTGMKGKKKVSKFFKDHKLSKFEKERTWLLCTKENEIIWIVGYRQDRRFTASVSSKDVLKISI
ncbi:tRNA(Ile)-lysidine synthase [Tenacibaculum jejuense]|uniref:tRNA(Ile)-lysidine synthase n=1 Tax=Tenacibaculum jejuense TaxID=584609 RepID=A0A238U6L6_9FLAO|nr:tRNA(Ile)-lysidine synthase [Tenacibaculum jejuense]